MANVVPDKHTPRSCIHTYHMYQEALAPTHVLSTHLTLAPHRTSPTHRLTAGTRRGRRTPAWGLWQASPWQYWSGTNGVCPPTPCSCRDSGKSCVGLAAHTHPHHAPPQGKQAETHAQGAPSFLLFCSFLVPQVRERFYGHSPISSCPQQRWNE